MTKRFARKIGFHRSLDSLDVTSFGNQVSNIVEIKRVKFGIKLIPKRIKNLEGHAIDFIAEPLQMIVVSKDCKQLFQITGQGSDVLNGMDQYF